MPSDETSRDRVLVTVIASVIIVNAFLFFLSRHQTFVHIDAIAHVNKARGLFDNFTPGMRQLGSIWLPLQHLLIAPLTWFDALWLSGAAGSLLSIACYIVTSVFLYSTGYAWTGSRFVGWMAFLFFALNPRLIYFFTTPMGEPLMILSMSGLIYYLVRWAQDESWKDFASAALMMFAGTLTRYEGWAIAAASIALVPFLARRQRAAATILFTGAACAGPMLWMLFNMAYFDDPLMFAYGRGSAQDYATGKLFPTAGEWWPSFVTYFIDVAYCLNPAVLWLGIAGLALSLILLGRRYWQPTIVILALCVVPFLFYVANLYANVVPIMMPGMLKDDPQSVYNVRYGTIMAATIPLFAALVLFIVLRQVERHRAYSLFLLTPLFLPDPIPAASREPIEQQFTDNLFYKEGIHNQSFWMPPFIEVSQRLQADIESRRDEASYILTNTRIVHVVAWTTGMPMRRFIHEMNKEDWESNLSNVDPRVRWVITEEGDQLWHAQAKFLQARFIEVARAKTESTGTVHLYRRP